MQVANPAVSLSSIRRETLVRDVLTIVAASTLIALSARLQVPGPVPFTMQTFAVLLIAGALGRVRATAAVLAYLVQGAAGLPVFAGGFSGPAYFFGPTAGYLLGFVVAACAIGWWVERSRATGFVSLTALYVIGHAIIFAGGVLWLATMLGFEKAIATGLLPFVVTGVLKSALAAVATPAVRRVVGSGR